MGRLFDLIQAHVDSQPYEVTFSQVAKKIGVSRQTVLNWKTPTKLIEKRHLEAISQVTGVPYLRVLDALLDDIGYLRPDPADSTVTPLSEAPSSVADEQLQRVAKRPRKRAE
jgi:transcriptional regulator with XRE-family HTH domain